MRKIIYLIFVTNQVLLSQTPQIVEKTVDTIYCDDGSYQVVESLSFSTEGSGIDKIKSQLFNKEAYIKEFKACCQNSINDNPEYLEDCEEIHTKTEILYSKNNIVSISENYDRVNLRYQLELYHNFDLITGELLKIDDLVNKNGIDYIIAKCSRKVDSIIRDLVDTEYRELKREGIEDDLGMRREFIKDLESEEYHLTADNLSNFYLVERKDTPHLSIVYSDVIMHYASPYLLSEEIVFTFDELKSYLKPDFIYRFY
ncbi:hypothetical protein [Aquimarina sp. SS2-1]|uniref:hypothetical protein n=1 Tax=Aquimarina besae TaxID=3342247 RepID=UPI00366BE77C